LILNISKYLPIYSVAILIATLFFSCSNDIKDVRDFLADKNLPIGVAENIHLIYKDSGNITIKMKSPLLHDYSNRKEHPYSEFPEGIHITKIYKDGDSTTIKGNYAISYTTTEVSEIRDNVVIINHVNNYILKTSQVFWDQKYHYFVTEKAFTFITPTDTLQGEGFEANEGLSRWHVRNNFGVLQVPDAPVDNLPNSK
jgi:LPS export ABC transporter protein LptC